MAILLKTVKYEVRKGHRKDARKLPGERVGVSYEVRLRNGKLVSFWTACYQGLNDRGELVQRKRRFSISKYGRKVAEQKAIEFRNKKMLNPEPPEVNDVAS